MLKHNQGQHLGFFLSVDYYVRMRKKIAKHKHMLLATLIGAFAIISLLYLIGRDIVNQV